MFHSHTEHCISPSMKVDTERARVLLGTPDQSRYPLHASKRHRLLLFLHILPPPHSRVGSNQYAQVQVRAPPAVPSSTAPADSRTGVQRRETLQNSPTVFQNKHLRVSPPRSIKIGLKQNWYNTLYFLHLFNHLLSLRVSCLLKNYYY